MRALQAPAHRQHAAGVDQATGQLANALGIEAANLRRPGCILADAIGRSVEISDQLIGAAGTAIEEVAGVPARQHDLASEAEHQRRVGVRADRPPFGADPFGQVVLQWRDVDDADAAIGDLAQIGFDTVHADAAGFCLRGARRQRAEHHKRLGVFGDGVERIGAAVAGIGAAERVAQDHGTSSDRIGVDVSGEAADQIQHPLQKR